MTYTFESCFASRIEDFIAQKNALGFGYLESSRLLRTEINFVKKYSKSVVPMKKVFLTNSVSDDFEAELLYFKTSL